MSEPNRKKNMLLPLCTFIIFSLMSLCQSSVENFDGFSRIAVLHKGRIKPLDTFARNALLQYSGKSSYKREPAVSWFARLVFTPDESGEDKVFMVNDMQVIEAMGLSLETSRRFSYKQLEGGLEKLRELSISIQKIEEKKRTRVQAEMIRLYHNIRSYTSLASCFQFAIPNSSFVVKDSALVKELGLAAYPANHSYYDMVLKSDIFKKYKHGKHEHNLRETPNDTIEALNLSQSIMQWAKYYTNMPIPILPAAGHEEEIWLSPWDVLNNYQLLQSTGRELEQLSLVTSAYLKGSQADFDLAVHTFNGLIHKRLQDKIDLGPIGLELAYNKYKPFFWSKFLYGLGLVFSLLSLVVLKRTLYSTGLVTIIIALIPHTAGMVFRMLIMGRPPVTNLYETFVFVGWMSAVLGLAMEIFQRKAVGLITAGFSGLAMLMIAEKYALEGDTMGMLVAVLDSNFWLATHVVTITMGYAGCCAAGVAGHVYILQELFSAGKDKLKDTAKTVYGVLAFGLIFSFIGTVLGGIWADQSWGRFWGWDPKENGALLIVLWCSILYHARLDGMIRNLGMAVGSILCIIIVMFAWFGVNLLGVGLHSYGFSSGVGLNLILYIAAESLFLLVCGWWIMQRKYRFGPGKELEKG
ncbi:cytochrome c biogenesis protein [Fibrobacterota bacterium]